MKCRLPVELVRHILAYLCDDDYLEMKSKAASLRSVCLASHTLCSIAAPQLYNTVVLTTPRQASLFFASPKILSRSLRLHMNYLWCGIVSEVLYDVPHRLTVDVIRPAKEVAWLQADADGRYHGFHYSTRTQTLSTDADQGEIACLHVVCPDLGRWAAPLFSSVSHVRQITISLYPRGNWDLEAAKIERVLRIILEACVSLESLQIVLCYTVAAAGSRTVRMTRSIPVAHAVRAVDDDRIVLKASEYLFDRYGSSPSEEVIQFTRLHWESRISGTCGPWLR